MNKHCEDISRDLNKIVLNEVSEEVYIQVILSPLF